MSAYTWDDVFAEQATNRRRTSLYDMPEPARPIHFECRGPACRACEAEQEIAERNEQ